jgi:hypothetical protein
MADSTQPNKHASSLAKRRWTGISPKERTELMQKIRQVKAKRKAQSGGEPSPEYLFAESVFQRQNDKTGSKKQTAMRKASGRRRV